MDVSIQTKFRAACLRHARDLITCAKKVEGDSPHIAYHLAALGLEEIGKSFLIRGVREEDEDRKSPLIDKHLKKLFWALYAPVLYERLEKRQVEEARDFALRIHRTRLAGLYVDWNEGRVFDPQEMVSADQAHSMIALAEARLRMEEHVELRELTDGDRKLLGWFSEASADREKSRFIFGGESLNKLRELKEAKAWFVWLKEQFDKSERESQEMIRREFSRPQPEGEERFLPKWIVRVRLRSLSHSIRQKALNEWNQRVLFIKLTRADSRELLVDLTLPKNISVDGLWWVGWGQARSIAAALNIGSMGFFWFTVPEAISRYYVSIEDLENHREIRAERVPSLLVDFGHMTLDSETLGRVGLALAFMPGPDDVTVHEPYSHYLTGLGFVGKNDVHMQVEGSAFMQFFLAFKTAMRVYSDWDGASDFREAAVRVLESRLPAENLGDNTTYGLIDLAENIQSGKPATKEITLSEVFGMKLICDAYFLFVFNRKGVERLRRERGSS